MALSYAPHPVVPASSGHPYPPVLLAIFAALRSLLTLCPPPLHECTREMAAMVTLAITLASPKQQSTVKLEVKVLTKKQRRKQQHAPAFMAVKAEPPRLGHTLALSALQLLDVFLLRGHVHMPLSARAKLDHWMLQLLSAADFAHAPLDDSQYAHAGHSCTRFWPRACCVPPPNQCVHTGYGHLLHTFP
ncbi:hypothetical protein PTSG_11012 [Salpingoeca rosetta]|uniref:Uncharacterized protein n=1 Tax=Salpingoeca rosetta (strain ATCC 50818 / BSB-021) TaxID=946362 RepID=F2USF8_SALR5|nr:uncharacterized protein PTSG_11012 [Salpingoeca rosetta]EGD81067.1 hypothetical protein PTSG_11012 [Salpingoeca rosetta]|eukprot:XP_004987936.1 hypothetical protein PTSG_11012 [Salpingoeca rosetta]